MIHTLKFSCKVFLRHIPLKKTWNEGYEKERIEIAYRDYVAAKKQDLRIYQNIGQKEVCLKRVGTKL